MFKNGAPISLFFPEYKEREGLREKILMGEEEIEGKQKEAGVRGILVHWWEKGMEELNIQIKCQQHLKNKF